MKLLLLLFAFTITLYAESLESLLQQAYKNDPTIKMLQEAAALSEKDEALSDIWENPMLKVGVNDIRLDDPASRSLEPMQTQFLSLSQKIPLSDKFPLKKEIATLKSEQKLLKIEEQERKIRAAISEDAYMLAIVKKRLMLLQKNRNNLRRIRTLFRGYQASEDLILEVTQALQLLRTKEEMFQSREALLKAKIARYTLHEVSRIEIALTPTKVEAVYDKKHPALELYRQNIAVAKKRISLAKAKERPDITVGAGYYQRANREDYLSLNVAFPLQIRGKEKLQTQKAKLSLSYQKSRLAELENRFQTEVRMLGILMQRHRSNYRLFQERIVPMQQRISAYLRAKNRSGALDMSRLITSYNRVIALQERALDELEGYFQNYAKLRYYL